VTQKGREGLIRIVQAEHRAASPFDTATMQFTGKRRLDPFFLIKEVDPASIGLRKAHATNESMKEWELKLFNVTTAGAAGVERNHLTIKLTDARICEIGFTLPDTRDPALRSYAEFERIGFLYKKIGWTWTDGGATHEDSLGISTASRSRKR
ncbi:MAG: type VI secretion system tube protein Hcp, partial [Alphaproteobacteria bacterium]|nr:type VI secretion system tube protein Hcp [Alphaproteobacteria bacterium]